MSTTFIILMLVGVAIAGAFLLAVFKPTSSIEHLREQAQARKKQ